MGFKNIAVFCELTKVQKVVTIWFPLWLARGRLANQNSGSQLLHTNILYCDWLNCLARAIYKIRWLRSLVIRQIKNQNKPKGQ